MNSGSSLEVLVTGAFLALDLAVLGALWVARKRQQRTS